MSDKGGSREIGAPTHSLLSLLVKRCREAAIYPSYLWECPRFHHGRFTRTLRPRFPNFLADSKGARAEYESFVTTSPNPDFLSFNLGMRSEGRAKASQTPRQSRTGAARICRARACQSRKSVCQNKISFKHNLMQTAWSSQSACCRLSLRETVIDKLGNRVPCSVSVSCMA